MESIGLAASVITLLVAFFDNGILGKITYFVDIILCIYLLIALIKNGMVCRIIFIILVLIALAIRFLSFIYPPQPPPVPTTPAPVPTTPVPAPTTPAPTTPTPIIITLESIKDYLPQTAYEPDDLKTGTTLRVINCNEYVSLQPVPQGDIKDKLDKIGLGETVGFVRADKNGFYLVNYNGKTGYVLAVYLTPTDIATYRGQTIYGRSVFSAGDLVLDGIHIGTSRHDDVVSYFGIPNRQFTVKNTKLSVIEYNDQSFFFDDGLLIKTILFGENGVGPRQTRVGMYLAEALSSFLFEDPSIVEGSSSHDLQIYPKSNASNKKTRAVIHNGELAGNGYITFRTSENNAFMDMVIKDSVVTMITIYSSEK